MQSDQRRGASVARTVPTVRVHRKIFFWKALLLIRIFKANTARGRPNYGAHRKAARDFTGPMAYLAPGDLATGRKSEVQGRMGHSPGAARLRPRATLISNSAFARRRS